MILSGTQGFEVPHEKSLDSLEKTLMLWIGERRRQRMRYCDGDHDLFDMKARGTPELVMDKGASAQATFCVTKSQTTLELNLTELSDFLTFTLCS